MNEIKDKLYAAKRINTILATEASLNDICTRRVDVTEDSGSDALGYATVCLEGQLGRSNGLNIEVSARIVGHQQVSYFINGEKVSLRDDETMTKELVRERMKNLTDQLLKEMQ